MTTRSTISHDAPVINVERLTDRQRDGLSCAWCAGTADERFPVRIAGRRLRACPCCAGMYGVPAVEVEQ